jgi:XTP/dITP diphosphohydrolase
MISTLPDAFINAAQELVVPKSIPIAINLLSIINKFIQKITRDFSLVKAYRIQEKTSQVGFDWENKEQVWEKVVEEMEEFKEELVKNESMERKEEEFGDLLFSLVNYARFEGINPENALEKVNMKFTKRFEYIENKAGERLTSLSLDEMNILWAEAKMQ